MARVAWLVVCACVLALTVDVSAVVSHEEAVETLASVHQTIQYLKSNPEAASPANRPRILAQLSHAAAKVGLPFNIINADDNAAPICFRDIQIRGGILPDLCMNASLPAAEKGRCYPACKEGFHGVEHICRENCKLGYNYHPLLDDCIEIGVVGPNTTGCPWYDSCGHLGARGCAKCPAGHPNLDLLLCECHLNHTQHSYKPVKYDRGNGEPAHCKAPRFMQGHLCYFNCTEVYKPFGSLCIETCPNKMQEIGIICCDTLSDCIQKVGKIATDALTLAENIVAAATTFSIAAVLDAIKSGIEVAMDLVVPDCIHA